MAARCSGNTQAQSLPLPKPGGPKEFEVVGLPLAEPGLHVVEAESTALGNLAAGEEGRDVRAHDGTGDQSGRTRQDRERRRVRLVTHLNDASVVPDATVRIRDCRAWSSRQARPTATARHA